jgi:hypothetical protein
MFFIEGAHYGATAHGNRQSPRRHTAQAQGGSGSDPHRRGRASVNVLGRRLEVHVQVFSSVQAAELYRVKRVSFPNIYEICELVDDGQIVPVQP